LNKPTTTGELTRGGSDAQRCAENRIVDDLCSGAADPTNRAVFDYTFTGETDLVGHMALSVFIEAEDVDDVDLFVGVEKLDRKGDEVYFFSAAGGNANGPVSRGWLRASKRELNAQRSTP
jgi:uncharacterized protein